MESTFRAPISSIETWSVRLPLAAPESDGTLTWDATEVVLTSVSAGGQTGIGYTYADSSIALLIRETLATVVLGRDALDILGSYRAQLTALRNLGIEGHAFRAVSALDVALWDLKARLLGVSVLTLLGSQRSSVPAYGSGGFTSLSQDDLCEQLEGWVERGLRSVKMKVGSQPAEDPARVEVARAAIGDDIGLFVDANGAYASRQAQALALRFADAGVSWFEEPVPQAQTEHLRWLREHLPTGMELTAGEYSTTLETASRLLTANAVDVLQADATRCGGFTGFLEIATLCEAADIPLSSHCAPALHAHLGCARLLRHVEYFHDHTLAEEVLFAGVPALRKGQLIPDPSAPGLGLTLKSPKAKGAPNAIVRTSR